MLIGTPLVLPLGYVSTANGGVFPLLFYGHYIWQLPVRQYSQLLVFWVELKQRIGKPVRSGSNKLSNILPELLGHPKADETTTQA